MTPSAPVLEGAPLLLAWQHLGHPSARYQLAAIGVCVLTAWVASRMAGRRADPARVQATGDPGFRPSGFWLLLLALIWLSPLVISRLVPRAARGSLALIEFAVEVVGTIAIARFAGYVLGHVLPGTDARRRIRQCLVWTAALFLFLHLFGLWPELMAELDGVQLAGKPNPVTLKMLLAGTLSLFATLAIALWAARLLERRILASAEFEMSFRVVAAKFLRALLLFIAVLFGLKLASVDLTLLSVFGGALGVGLAFGLQKTASNYISGFIILLDRSIRIGDYVSVDKYAGVIQGIYSRYTVLRTADGTEAIIPNETMITSVVSNHSFTDRLTAIKVQVTVDFDTDIERATALLLATVEDDPRILTEPRATAMINRLTGDGVELELSVWINDPQNGAAPVRSGILQRTLTAYRAHGIRIPLPRRDVILTNPSGITPALPPCPPSG
jgi:small-conductance mechanosensitive channel